MAGVVLSLISLERSPTSAGRWVVLGLLSSLLLASGCETDLDVDSYEYRCTSSSDCINGYRCTHVEEHDASICVPPGHGGPGDAGSDADAQVVDAADAQEDTDTHQDADAHRDADAADTGCDGGGCSDVGDADPPGTRVVPVTEAELTLYENTAINTDYNWYADAVVIGDLDGDELDDLAIGTAAANNGDGVVDILFSDTFPKFGAQMLASPGGHVMRLEAQSPSGDGRFGATLAAIEDLDGDTIPELAVGEPGYSTDSNTGIGAVHVYTSISLLAGNTDPELTLTGTDDGGAAGSAIVALGDVDGDGTADFAVGAPGPVTGDDFDDGSVYVLSGADVAAAAAAVDDMLLEDMLTLWFEPFGQDSGLGVALDSGDFDGDGQLDLALSAPGLGNGKVFLVYGSKLRNAPDQVDLSTSSDVLTITHTFSGGVFGLSVALGGSFDDDGVDDLVIGAPYARESDTGAAYVIYGMQNQQIFGEYAVTDFSGLTTINGETPGQRFGETLAYAGDLDNSGTDALVIGASDSPGQDGVSQGKAYLFLGPYSESTVAATDDAVIFVGQHEHDNLGFKVSAAGTFGGGDYPGLLLYAEAGDIDGVVNDVPTWYFFAGPLSRP